VGPDPTLPPNNQPPPKNRHARSRPPGADVDRDLVLNVNPNQPPASRPGQDRADDLAHQQEAAVRLHRQLTDLDAGARLAQRPAEDPEPLGRRLPVPLAGREGVER
jgi:hypothetical protein